MKLSQLNAADTARRDLRHLRLLQDKTSRAVRYDGHLTISGETTLLMTTDEVDVVL